LLASCQDGCTEAIMHAHGFTTGQMVELVRAGLEQSRYDFVRTKRDRRGGLELVPSGAFAPSKSSARTHKFKTPLTKFPNTTLRIITKKTLPYEVVS
jgi:hypothetical protein